jgi:hypothetical protein
MSMDMLIRKKALKIQERLGMRLGLMHGISSIPVVRTPAQCLDALREMYKIGMRAFVIPKEMFSDIHTAADLYKGAYGDLLKIKDIASKFNIELSIQHPSLPDDPDDVLKVFCNIANIMDARTFIISPDIYKNMPKDQSLRLAVYKINEIMTGMRVNAKIGIETTGKMNEIGSLEEVIDIVKRTQGTEPIVNWGNIHARGSGALRTEEDFRRVMEYIRTNIGSGWFNSSFFIFSGTSYGPSGKIRTVPLEKSDISLRFMVRQAVSSGAKGTLIFDDPDKERFILKILEELGDMVR